MEKKQTAWSEALNRLTMLADLQSVTGPFSGKRATVAGSRVLKLIISGETEDDGMCSAPESSRCLGSGGVAPRCRAVVLALD